jgi:hypothetical protein
MLLLDPNEIKEEKKENIVQTQKRNISLATEEAKLNKAINLTKQNAEKKKAEILKEVDEFVEKQRARADILIKEVELLELRKNEALKPVDDIKKEWEGKLEEVKEVLRETKQGLAQIEEDKEKNLELADKLQDKAEDLALREEKIEKREKGTTAEEKRLRESSNALSDGWVKLHEDTNKVNTEIAKKEQDLRDREKVLDIRGEEQDKREVEQNNHDRQIKDRYQTLERAIEESKKKHNIKI